MDVWWSRRHLRYQPEVVRRTTMRGLTPEPEWTLWEPPVKIGTRQKRIRLASLRTDDTHKSRMLPQLCGNTSQVYGNPIQIPQFHMHWSCLTNRPSHSATTQFYLRVPHLIVSEFLVNSVAATDSERAYRQNTIQPPAANMPYLTLPKLLVLL